MVSDYQALGRHPYFGRSVVLGDRKNDWQDTHYILPLFGNNETTARRRYSEFVRKGIAQRRRPELLGGGLLRSQGGWAAVKALRRSGAYQRRNHELRKSAHARGVLCYWTTDQLGIAARADIESNPARPSAGEKSW